MEILFFLTLNYMLFYYYWDIIITSPFPNIVHCINKQLSGRLIMKIKKITFLKIAIESPAIGF